VAILLLCSSIGANHQLCVVDHHKTAGGLENVSLVNAPLLLLLAALILLTCIFFSILFPWRWRLTTCHSHVQQWSSQLFWSLSINIFDITNFLNCIMRSCMVCTLRPVLLGWTKQGGWDGRGMWRAWGRWGVHATFWLGGVKGGDH
jgi:hypothetical protein